MELRDELQRALGPAIALERELSGGGMSRVFVARDLTLKREIAVKLIRPDLASGVSNERFKREIELAASLQHPHIVPVLSAGTVDGLPFYTMPFVRGESLRQRLTRDGALSLGETVRILRDLASALAHAHDEGVVHRDIKPENVMLSGGVAVVTDFGVAKAVNLAAADGDGAQSGLTSIGVALGTPAYMSPEQASANPDVDHRADIYSFGCVAYEMLTGASPFGSRSPQQMLSAHVIETPADVAVKRSDIPADLAVLVMRCLSKMPADRPDSSQALVDALDAISTPSGGTRPTTARIGVRGSLPLAAALMVVATVATGLFLFSRRDFPFMQVQSTRILSAAPPLELDPAISPDGKLVAYAAGPLGRMRIYVRQLAGGRVVPLAESLPGTHRWPTWSPDGTRILFLAMHGSLGTGLTQLASLQSTAYMIPYVGGAPRIVVEGNLMTPAWSPDGKTIAFGSDSGIVIKSLAGGDARIVVAGAHLKSSELLHSPAFSPDGRMLAYVAGNGNGPLILNIAASTIWMTPLDVARPTRLTDEGSMAAAPVWSPDGGSVLYVSNVGGGSDIYEQRVSAAGAIGERRRITTGLGVGALSLSSDGAAAVYSVLRRRSQIWSAPITPHGAPSPSALRQETTEAEAIEGLGVSTDGTWLVYDSDRSGNQDIYKKMIGGSETIQLTNDPAPDFVPQWSRDGREIAYYSMRAGSRDIRVMSADGSNDFPVTRGPSQEMYPTWSPDARALAFVSEDRGGQQIVISRRDATGGWLDALVVTSETAEINFPRWSPDGNWIAFIGTSGDGDRAVRIIDATGGPSRLVVTDAELPGIRFVDWSADSRDLVVRADGGAPAFWAVPIGGGARRLLLRIEGNGNLRRQEFATDGRRLYFTVAADESDIWMMELIRRQ